jgi:lipopolysaccharide transport system permease protein
MLRGVWRHRDLVFTLIRRNYQLRYRQSLVGLAWALVPPLAALGAGTVLFQTVFGVDTGRVSYPVFAMAALVPWTFFANSLTQGIPSIVSNLTMVTRLPFPRAALPLSMVGISLLDLAVAAVALAILAVAFGDGLAPAAALWGPVLILIELPLAIGLVLLGSALNVFARDVRLAVPLLVQFWLFLTPVLYGRHDVPERVRDAFMANPMTGLVVSFRRALLYGEAPSLAILWPTLVSAGVAFLVGWWYFASTERRFADVI